MPKYTAGIAWHHRLIATLSALLPLVLVPKDAPLKKRGGRTIITLGEDQQLGEQPSQKIKTLQYMAQSNCELRTMRSL